MSAFEFWIDLCGAGKPACTLFGEIEMQVRPQAGERISFHQKKGSSYEFQVVIPVFGLTRQNIVSAEINEISHYAVPAENGLTFKSVIRTKPLNLGTFDDVRIVRDILTKQAGLEVDPYGLNNLDKE